MVEGPRAEKYVHLSQHELEWYNKTHKNKIRGYWVLEMDNGDRYYGFESAAQIQNFLKFQRGTRYEKNQYGKY